MKVALVMLTSGSLSGGAAKYLRLMVPLMAADKRVDELKIFLPRKAAGDMPSQWQPWAWREKDWLTGRAALKRELGSFGPDVLFIPTARWVRAHVPTVVMVRNMEPFAAVVDGNRQSDKLRNALLRRLALEACEKSDAVIAVSEHVRDTLAAVQPAALSKTHVVYHGSDAKGDARRPEAVPANIPPFVFTAGSIRPARGLADLIGAWTSGRIRPLPPLVIAGVVQPHLAGFHRSLMEQAAAAGVQERVIWAGSLSTAEMSWCFQNSALFVMTSRAEACPNIVLEAMSHGCLSVSTDTPPMPEFFQSAALYYTAGDPKSLADKVMQALILSAADQHAMRTSALARSQEFSWQRTSSMTIDVLQTVARRPDGL